MLGMGAEMTGEGVRGVIACGVGVRGVGVRGVCVRGGGVRGTRGGGGALLARLGSRTSSDWERRCGLVGVSRGCSLRTTSLIPTRYFSNVRPFMRDARRETTPTQYTSVTAGKKRQSTVCISLRRMRGAPPKHDEFAFIRSFRSEELREEGRARPLVFVISLVLGASPLWLWYMWMMAGFI